MSIWDDYAFGSASLEFATSAVEPFVEGASSPAEVVAWIEGAQDRLAGHVAALDVDRELDRLRLTNWGERRPTRWIIAAMITHDAYHAGEINHIRSILGPDDRWRYIQMGFG